MRRAAGIALCLLAGCGLFPELEYLSTCQEGCGGSAGQTGSAGSGGAGLAGASGSSSGAGGKAGASDGGAAGKAGAGVSAGSSGAAGTGASGGQSAGANGGGSGGGSGGASGNAGSSGAGGSVVGGTAGTAGATSGAGSGGAAGISGASGSASGNGPGGSAGSGGAAGAVTAGAGGTGGNGGSGAGGTAGAGGGGDACPSGRGPAMVRLPKSLGGGCIDSTEVTFGQYQEFLLDDQVDPADQPAACALNTVVTAFTPTSYIYDAYKTKAATYGSYAVSGVDWCDARAFCEWSGKKLCGKVGGGALPKADRNLPTDQWWLACATSSQKTYPYANLTIGGVLRPDSYDKALCHTDDKTTPEPLIRQWGVTTTCEGGVPGLYDMSGNVMEWSDSCEAGAEGKPETDLCAMRGGSFNFQDNAVHCKFVQTAERVRPLQKDTKDPNGLYYSLFGFRCCSE